MDEKTKRVLLRFEARCSRAEMCSSDVRAKVLKAFADDSDANERTDEVMESLRKDRFVDDLRYASAFAREKSSLTGWGPIKISCALAAKKIPRETIAEALQEIDGDKSSDRLRKLLESKWKTLTGPDGTIPQDARLKLIRFALSRGYDYDSVRGIIEDITTGRSEL